MKQKVLKSFPGLGQPCGGLNESQPSTAWFLEVGGLPAFGVTLLAYFQVRLSQIFDYVYCLSPS